MTKIPDSKIKNITDDILNFGENVTVETLTRTHNGRQYSFKKEISNKYEIKTSKRNEQEETYTAITNSSTPGKYTLISGSDIFSVERQKIAVTGADRIGRGLLGIFAAIACFFTLGLLVSTRKVEQLFADTKEFDCVKNLGILTPAPNAVAKKTSESNPKPTPDPAVVQITKTGQQDLIDAKSVGSNSLSYQRLLEGVAFIQATKDTYLRAFENSRHALESNPKFLNFFSNEFAFIKNELEAMNQQLEEFTEHKTQWGDIQTHNISIIAELQKKMNSIGELQEKMNPLEQIQGNSQAKPQEQIQNKPVENIQQRTIPALGIRNQGSSCYINASLQALLIIPSFDDLTSKALENCKNKTDTESKGKKSILEKLALLIKCHRDKGSPDELGKCVAELRIALFTCGLDEANFESGLAGLYNNQDAGPCLEGILTALGCRHQTTETTEYILEGGKEDSDPTIMNVPRGVLICLNPNIPSVQDYINSLPFSYEEGNPPYTRALTGNKIVAKSITTRYTGSAPEIISIQLPINPDSGKNEYQLKDKDHQLDLSELYPNTAYELVGTCINHGQYHWTGQGKTANGWFHFNDHNTPIPDVVSRARPSYLIYKKISPELYPQPQS